MRRLPQAASRTLCEGGSTQESGRTMMDDKTSLATRTHEPTRRQAITRVAMVFGGLALVSTKALE